MTERIRAVIADDEPLARRGVRQLLERHCDFAVIAEARTGRETIRIVDELKPDLLFLDIQMRDLDGFEVLRELDSERIPAIVFVTAYDQFAVQAFDACAFDYLVKPLKEARFAQTLDRVRERLQSAKAGDLSRRLAALLAEREKEHTKHQLLVQTPTGQLMFDADEIDWIEADDYYAAIHTRGSRHLIRESLNSLEKRLGSTSFVRTHRAAIVNIQRLREWRCVNGETLVVLTNGAQVPVSRRNQARVKALFRTLRK